MADILYVVDGYVTLGYVQSTRIASTSSGVSAGSLTSAQGTLTATGSRIQQASATLVSNQSGLTWAEMGTWAEPKQEYWGPNFTATADKFLGGTVNASSTATLSATGTATFKPTITIDGVLQSTLTANLVGSGIILSLGSATVTTDGSAIARTSATLNTSATLSADGDLVGKTTVLNLGSASLTATPTLTGAGVSSMSANASTQITGGRVQLGASAFTPQCTLSADAIIAIGGTASLQGTASLSVNEVGIFITRGGTVNMTGVGSWNIVAGKLAEGVANLNSTGSTLIIGSQFAIDPFRVFTIPTESRINILQQETRNHLVPSETRKYQVQHLSLVDETGILDRREG